MCARRHVSANTALLVVAVVLLVDGCAGYVPGRKSYWDAKIKKLCEKDGGVTIYERIHISKEQIERGVLPRTWPSGQFGVGEPNISFSPRRLARPDAPVYSEVPKDTVLREKNPRVIRRETTVIRRADQAVVARWTTYSRSGGDLIVVDVASGFSCPDPRKIWADFQRLFILED